MGFSAGAASQGAEEAGDSCTGMGAARFVGRSHDAVQLPGLTLGRFSGLLVTSQRGLLFFLRQAAQKPSFDQLELSEVEQPSASQG